MEDGSYIKSCGMDLGSSGSLAASLCSQAATHVPSGTRRSPPAVGTGRVFPTNIVNWMLNNLDRVDRSLAQRALGLYNAAYNPAVMPNNLLLRIATCISAAGTLAR
jgi:hypothetical protein